ncbi:hypothetical protein DdX_01300 [Ditylenchus destructor]|uniref:Uncharacterized protein n=1 Tax=Ditylenchus destructor TaxID=166010 RepID=A0AAD4RDT0_9BILA|nr:hypothetical protein DdX_01300 [Ditylenchus destructor]
MNCYLLSSTCFHFDLSTVQHISALGDYTVYVQIHSQSYKHHTLHLGKELRWMSARHLPFTALQIYGGSQQSNPLLLYRISDMCEEGSDIKAEPEGGYPETTALSSP